MDVFAPDMIRDHARFAGRWSEIQHICVALDRRSPALVLGPRQSGRSSLAYHVVHAAPALFDQPTMQSYFIDLRDCPDVDTLRRTIAAAFQQHPSRWQMHLTDLAAAPLLVFDNCDAPQLADTIDVWWQELLPLVRDGRLRVLATAVDAPSMTLMPWRTVAMHRVDGAMLDDIVSAQLGDDAPRLSRPDHTWMLQHSRGHIGVLMAYLRAWQQARAVPGRDWRAQVAQIPVSDEALASPQIATVLASEWYLSDDATDAPTPPPATSDVALTPQPVVAFEVPGILWVIAGGCLVVLVWMWWRGGM
ncbi:MAG: hypothetical protein ACKO83_10685 [Roseiflexaceae bacterium]